MIEFLLGWDAEQWKIAETYYNMMNKNKAVSLQFNVFAWERDSSLFEKVQNFWYENKNREPAVLSKVLDLSAIAPWRLHCTD